MTPLPPNNPKTIKREYVLKEVEADDEIRYVDKVYDKKEDVCNKCIVNLDHL